MKTLAALHGFLLLQLMLPLCLICWWALCEMPEETEE